MIKDLSWEVAVQRVLEASSDPMRCADIAEQVSVRGLKRSIGANPAASIAAILSKSLQEDDTPFQRVGPGQYTLRSQLRDATVADRLSTDTSEEVEQTGALRAFGMYWRRDHIIWRNKPRIFGRQGVAATRVNFAGQIGLYLLHDRDRVIYVGGQTLTTRHATGTAILIRRSRPDSQQGAARVRARDNFGLDRKTGIDLVAYEPSHIWPIRPRRTLLRSGHSFSGHRGAMFALQSIVQPHPTGA